MTDRILGFDVAPYGSPQIGTFVVPGTPVKLSVRKEVATLLIGFATDFNNKVEKLSATQSGGHNPRKIAGSNSWSRHAPGIALDLNWNWHPMGQARTFTSAQVTEIRKLLKKWSHDGVALFRWGGDYTNRKDEMHFELNIPRTVALAAVKVLQTPPRPIPNPSAWYKGDEGTRELRQGMSGEDVKYLQRYVGPKRSGPEDGKFGPKVKSGVMWYQGIQGLKKTGIVDKATWKTLEVKVKY